MSTIGDLFDLSEFSWVDPESMHLVKKPANGVDSPLLAKAADAMAEAIDELTKQFVEGSCGDRLCKVCEARFTALYGAEPDFVEKAKMKAKERHALSGSDFAFPKQRKEPLNDASHVRNAMSRFSQVQGVSAEERKAAAHKIIARAKALGIEVSEDSDVAQAAKDTASTSASEVQTHAVDAGPEGERSSPDNDDHGEARHVAAEDEHVPESDGSGDTAPDKELHRSEAEAQTHDNIEGNAAKSEVDMTGDTAPNGDAEAHEAQNAAEGQTRQTPASVASEGETSEESAAQSYASKETPGSSEWEHKDVALGEKAESLVNELREVVTTFTEREKAEGGSTAKSARIISRVKKLLEKPALIKEIAETMSAVDVLKSLDEQDSARRSEDEAQKASDEAFQKAVRKEAKKVAKKMLKKQAENEGEVAKDSEESKAADEVDLSTMSKKELVERIESLSKTVDDIASQDGKRPFLSGVGVTSILRGEQAPDVFKALDDRVDDARDRVAKASTDIERDRAERDLQGARQQRFTAKLIAQSNSGERTRFGPNSAQLFKTGLETLPEDTGLGYVERRPR